MPGELGAWRSPWVRLLVVALGYYVSARLGLQLALVGDVVTPLWPPTGVAVVALAALGLGVWPAVAIAAFAVNLPIADTPVAAAVIAVGNTLAPIAAALLLKRLDFDRRLARLRDALVLVIVALVSMTISATIGTAVVAATGEGATAIVDTWWVWWAGDAMGVLIAAPVLWSLSWVRTVRRRPVPWSRLVEILTLFVVLDLVAMLAVQSQDGLLFLVLPVLGWIAWRFQQSVAAPAGLMTSIIVTLAAAHDEGIFRFADETLLRKMAVLQAFNASVALTVLVFAAAVTERRRILEALYQREHRIAESLQRSLLPQIPDVPGVSIAVRYAASTEDAEVAGDWYDVIPLGGDRLGLVVGDVAGHGISAAAAMAQLRIGLRTYALDGRGPAATLRALNRMAAELAPGTMATVLYAEFEPGDGAIRIADAGHPRPLLIRDGDARFLDATPAAPLGVVPDLECEEAVHTVPEGATLLFFTDGLVERREIAIDDSLEALRQLAAGLGGERDIDVDALCDRITEALGVSHAADDVALLALRPTSLAGQVLRVRRPAIPAAVAEVRQILGRWLDANGASKEEAFDVLVACAEAQTNAVRHAYRGPDGIVEVEASIDAGRITVAVRDQGTWRDPSVRDGQGGRGLPLIEALMEVQVHADDAGTEVRMHKELSAAAR